MSIERAEEVRDHLVAALEADLIGPVVPGVADETLVVSPSRFYLTGFIAPQGGREVMPTDDDEDLDEAPKKDDVTAGEKEAEPREKRLFPASIGMSVLLSPETRKLRVTLSWADYRFEELAPEAPAEDAPEKKKKGRRTRPVARWHRVPQGPETVTIDVGDARLRTGIDVPRSRGLAIVAEILPTGGDMPGLPAGTRALSVFVVNRRVPQVEKRREDEEFAFQVAMALDCDEGFTPRANVVAQESTDFDERVADLQYRDRREYAVGHGIAVLECKDDGKVTHVEATWLPRAVVQRVEPRKVDGVVVSMDALAEVADVRAALGGIAAAYGAWIEEQKGRAASLASPHRRATARELMARANRARGRIEAGLRVLEEDANALTAFRLMNRAMAEAARRRDRAPDARPAWRLFQIAFVLLNLPALVDPTTDDRKTVDLIFFPTGGGKTEAYLGVIGFLLLYRRLTRRAQPDGGLGVAVILRYTLRLLTLDQLGRAATLICALERLRKAGAAELGDVRFSLGLWVGQSATANTLEQVVEDIDDHKNGGPSPFPLTNCPWCGAKLDAGALTYSGTKGKPTDVRVACVATGCDFATSGDPDGLPVLFVDEQIYAELPSFLIATVDKFAMLPWRGETGGFFGRVHARQGRRFYGPTSGPAPKGAVALPEGLPPPDLIVQDELHLISGPLGTMVGLYETAIEDLATRGEGAKRVVPKIIASTATVRRAQQQIQALYGRDDLQLFPPPGLDENESFFAQVARGGGRTYLGVAASGRALRAILLRVYVALLGAGERCAAENLAAANPYLTLVGYFNSLRELGGMRRLVEDEVRTRVRTIEERRPEQATTHPWVKNRAIKPEPIELTSRRSTADIARDKTRLEQDATSTERVDVCLASNMISVGVDIKRLGLMVIAGQPKTASEYIQASSRVGRQAEWPGLVVTVLNVAKARDRSHHERFCAFHASFYREVEATSVTPFADPAILRGLAGTLVAMTRHRDPELTPPGAVAKFRARRASGEAALARLVARVEAQPGHWSEAAGRVRDLGRALLDSWDRLSDDEEVRRYSHLEKGAKGKSLLYTVLDQADDERGDDEKKFAAPTSMRDVEASAHLWIKRGLPAKKEGEADE